MFLDVTLGLLLVSRVTQLVIHFARLVCNVLHFVPMEIECWDRVDGIAELGHEHQRVYGVNDSFVGRDHRPITIEY